MSEPHIITVKELDKALDQTLQLAASVHKKGTKTLTYEVKTHKFTVTVYRHGSSPSIQQTDFIHTAVDWYNNAG